MRLLLALMFLPALAIAQPKIYASDYNDEIREQRPTPSAYSDGDGLRDYEFKKIERDSVDLQRKQVEIMQEDRAERRRLRHLCSSDYCE